MSKVRLAIIGNGMVGHRFIEELLDKAPAGQFDITVFCEEPRIAYDRVHLSSYFSHHTAEELSLVREGFYEKHGVKVLVGHHRRHSPILHKVVEVVRSGVLGQIVGVIGSAVFVLLPNYLQAFQSYLGLVFALLLLGFIVLYLRRMGREME